MIRSVVRAIAVFCVAAVPTLVCAEPIKLKLSFFTSDRSLIYRASIKPFVDAVNEEGKDIVQIEVYFSGAISAVQAEQPQLILDGRADIAMVVPGQTPDRFPDTSVLELPGLFHDSRKANAVFQRLIAQGVLSGFDDFYVVGSFLSAPENVHSRKKIESLADLQGLTIRTNNRTESVMLEKLGAIPVHLAGNNTTTALTSGKIDGATFPPSMLFEFGLGRVAVSHYMIELGRVPTALLMSRKKLESLPPEARAIIEKYSGQFLSDQTAMLFAEQDREVLAQLKADPRRTVVTPTDGDLKTIDKAAADTVKEWLDSSPRHHMLYDAARREIATLRGTSGSN